MKRLRVSAVLLQNLKKKVLIYPSLVHCCIFCVILMEFRRFAKMLYGVEAVKYRQLDFLRFLT